jgi:ribA/ribD-fused uncharacterized protein
MKYSVEKILLEDHAKKYIFFWGHQSSRDRSISKSCFSQWWISSFTVDGIEYKTAEHWMMAKKAELFNDKETMEKIIKANSPAEAKKLGREVKNYIDETWLKNRYKIVVEGNLNKFGLNPELKDFLLKTGQRILVEASPLDPIWGIGLAEDNPDINFPEKWKGLNLLGFALMEVRDKLSIK